MHPALETLLLPFTGDGALAIPERSLFLGAMAHPLLRTWPRLTGWQPLKPLADEWDRAGFARVDDLPDAKWPLVLMLPGKSADETFGCFATARDHLEAGGRIVAALSNNAGASRFEKSFARACGHVDSLQKNKCRAFHACDDGTWDESLFAEWRALLQPHEIDGGFITRPGIFSSAHVDPGSQLLVSQLPTGLQGRVADLGAGWGFLSDALLRRCPRITRIDLYEADARALDCARRNLAGRAAVEIGFHWHDVTAGLPETYDVIVMNPPFHSGQATDVALGRAFLTSAAAALRRGGKLWLVANRQLPYESLLDALKLRWRKVVEDATYKVLSAEKC